MCADPKLRGALMRELRAELAARRSIREAGRDALPRRRPAWASAAFAIAAPAAAVVLALGFLL